MSNSVDIAGIAKNIGGFDISNWHMFQHISDACMLIFTAIVVWTAISQCLDGRQISVITAIGTIIGAIILCVLFVGLNNW